MVISQIPTLRVHIWQVRSGYIYPNLPQWFHRFIFWELIFGRPGLRRSTFSNGNITDSYSEGSYLVDQVLADLPPSNGNFTDSYSENSYFTGQDWTYLPLSPTVISQIPTLRTHIWQARSGDIYPNPPQWFHRFLLWEFIFGRPGLGRSTPLKLQFHRFLLQELIFGRQGLGRSTPLKWQFHRFLIWELIFGRSGLDISTPIPHSDFTDSYTDNSDLPDQVLAYLPSRHQTVISQIPTLRAHIWTTRS